MPEQATTSESWPQPGDQAVIYSNGHMTAPIRVTRVTVERVTKRDVVLSNGDRCRRDTLRFPDKGPWSPSVYLVRPDDPRVAAAEATIRRRRAEGEVHRAYDEWSRSARNRDADRGQTLDDLVGAASMLRTLMRQGEPR